MDYYHSAHSLVTGSLIRKTTLNQSSNEGYKFGQEESTYKIVLRNLFNLLISSLQNFDRSLRFFLAAWLVVGIWLAALGISTMA